YDVRKTSSPSRFWVGSTSTPCSWFTTSPAPMAICALLVLIRRGPTAAPTWERRTRPRDSLVSNLPAAVKNQCCHGYLRYEASTVPRSSRPGSSSFCVTVADAVNRNWEAGLRNTVSELRLNCATPLDFV